MARTRVGIVLLVPPPVDREIDALRRAARDDALGRIPPHVTLVPPVNIRDVAAAVATVKRAAKATKQIDAHIGPARTFAPVTDVLYLAVESTPPLDQLKERLTTGELDRPRTYEFVPHVTIGKAADPAPYEGYETDVTFESLTLLREGPDRVWRILHDEPFGGPVVRGRGGLPVELRTTTHAGYARRIVIDAWREGEHVGTAEVWVQGERAVLTNIEVVERARGQGIGGHLFAAAREHGVETTP